MVVNQFLARQFACPHGLGGWAVARVMNRQNLPLYRATIALAELRDDGTILDIGCGNGFVLAQMANETRGQFAGIDISPSMVTASKRRNQNAIDNGRMVIELADATRTPFKEGSFTRAVSINTAYFWPNADSVFNEVRRVLAPGGHFVNSLYTNEYLSARSHTAFGYQLHEPEALADSARSAGFVVTRVPLLGGRAYALVCGSVVL